MFFSYFLFVLVFDTETRSTAKTTCFRVNVYLKQCKLNLYKCTVLPSLFLFAFRFH